MAKTTWTPNEKQTRFLEILKENPDGITLREIKSKYGIEFATGTLNALLPQGKNLVKKADFTRDFTADIVYQGEIIGHKPYKDTVYVLVG